MIKKKVAIFAALLMVFSTSALAQNELIFEARHTKSCLNNAETISQQRQCIGLSANACMSANNVGGSTYGMGGCLSLEAEWWDGRLNDAYQILMRREKADDAENLSLGDNIPKKAPALRDMQRAWIKYRDATCTYEYSQWGGGTGGGPASVACVMMLTGEQALYLETGGGKF